MRVKDSDPHYNSLSYWLTVNILFVFLVASDADSVAQADPGMITFCYAAGGRHWLGSANKKSGSGSTLKVAAPAPQTLL